MSYDVCLEAVRPCSVYDGNMTSNVAGIWRKALERASGRVVEWTTSPVNLGGLEHLRGLAGSDAAKLCLAAAEDIEKNAELYRPMEPENRWGNAAGAARFLRELGEAWAANPDAMIRVSR